MSNTLNTPVEALERELPLRVTRYALRRGSGGAGAHRGGDGVVREMEALREMTFSLITERRRHSPPGAHGGQPGARGRNLLIEASSELASEPPDHDAGRERHGSPTATAEAAVGRELPGKVTGVLRPGAAAAHRNPRRRWLRTAQNGLQMTSRSEKSRKKGGHLQGIWHFRQDFVC